MNQLFWKDSNRHVRAKVREAREEYQSNR
jgi:hypothetical protein